MHAVHTWRRVGEPFTSARTRWMFGFQRRRVFRSECDTELPHDGPLPHTSHTAAIGGAFHTLDRARCSGAERTRKATSDQRFGPARPARPGASTAPTAPDRADRARP